MQFKLKDYQDDAVRKVLRRLDEAKDDYRSKDRRIAFALSAITGAGKTVMASAVFEALFDGSEDLEVDGDPTAVVLWVTDDPNLNAQTRFRIMEASDRLGAERLTVIDDGFQAERFDTGSVYFLNRQKLTAKTFITQTNKRNITLWDTIGNTINDPNRTLYLVLDEAHRGMRQGNGKATDEQDRSSTVLRLINGHNGTPAAPIVWGISATVDRFNDAMKEAKDRSTLPNVVVDNVAVQASGLLKDTIVLDLPNKAGAFATVLAREAAKATKEASELWEEYGLKEAMPATVRPLLVVQVPNKPSDTEIKALLDTIYDEWPDLEPDAVANVFGTHADETYGQHVVPYVAPQDVQEAAHIRVLLAKDAISTGWDCPRAETLVSLRPAKDRTHITQLLGRLVRTPLARRVESDDRLNAVTCFLPYFDLATAKKVADIMTGAAQDPDGPPPPPSGKVLINPETMLWNPALPDTVKECLAGLPSRAAPKAGAKPVKRLLNMAAELALDGLASDPNAQAFSKLYAVLDGQAAQYAHTVEKNVADILTADLKRITANRLSRTSTESVRQVEADDRTVDDAFRLATRAFGAAIANGYARRLALAASHEDEEDFDIHSAKATAAALALIPAVVDGVEAAADKIVTDWFASQHAAIKSLTEQRKSVYDEIRQQAKSPQEIDLVIPTSRIEMTFQSEEGKRTPLATRDRHVLCNGAGDYPVGTLRPGELAVLDIEMARHNARAWYRNPSSVSKDALQVPWQDSQRWRSMQPDFIFFTASAGGSVVASLIDPHGHHLGDALGKLRGLADFAEMYSDRFLRIEAVSKNDRGDLGAESKGTLRMLDLTNSGNREIVRNSKSAADAYRDAGQQYE